MATLLATHYIDSESRFATVDGTNIHYKRSGNGNAILLIHGTGSSLHGFDGVASRMKDHEVIRLDLPGFGLTGPRADRDYRIQTFAKTVKTFMELLELRHYTIAGNSLGGNIAWNLALDCPERLDALILINATGYPGKSLPLALRLARNPLTRFLLRRPSRGMVARNLRTSVGPNCTVVDDKMIDRVYALMSRPGNQRAFIDFARTAQRDRTAEIPGIRVPTLVLRSTRVDGQFFSRDIGGSLDIAYPDGGHLLPEEAPEWVSDKINAFLSERSPQVQSQP